MSKIATVVALQGKVWAKAADGALRELKVGDKLTGNETLILAAGATIDVSYGTGPQAQVITFAGPEASSPAILPPNHVKAFVASPDLVRMVNEDLAAQRGGKDDTGEIERIGDGYGFVQLVRISELIEADGITPLTLVRIKELIPPLALDWHGPEYEIPEWRYSRSSDEENLNRPPVAHPDAQTIPEDEIATGNVLGNDADPEGRHIFVTRFEVNGQVYAAGQTATIAGVGTIVINADGSYVFTPVADWNGVVPTITYTVSDGDQNGTATSTLDITVTPVVDIAPDSTTTHAGTPVTTNVLGNDSFENSGAQVTGVTQGQHGTVVINPNGTITYTPAPGYVGPDSYTYTVTSGGVTETTTVTVNVTNTLPVARPEVETTPEDTVLTGNVLANDSDANGDAIRVTQFQVNGQTYVAGQTATIAGIGTIVINSNGTYAFTPVADWNGTVPTVTYTISDGNQGGTATSTLNITVTPVADITPDSATTHAGTPVTTSVLGNDTFENSGAQVTGVTQGAHGTVVINQNGTITYTPAPGYVGPDSYTYTVTSGGGTETTTVTVNVTNTVPVAQPEVESIPEDTVLTGNVLTNDSDANGDPLAVTQFHIGNQTYSAGQTATIPGVGTLVINGNGSYTFTPVPDWNGTVPTVTYTVSDGNQGGTTTSTLDITVTPVADITPDTITTHAGDPVTTDVLGNDDFENDDAEVTAVTQGEHGSVTINPDGTITYTPAPGYVGPDSYTYTVTSGGVTETTTVTVNVANIAPVASPEVETTPEDVPLSGNVLTNEVDGDGDPLTVTQFQIGNQTYTAGQTATIPGAGTIVINSDGSYTFTPVPDWNGTVPTVTYTVSDGNQGGTTTSTLNITVTPVNDPPVREGSLPAQNNEDADIDISVDVKGAFSDIDGDTLTYTATGLPLGVTLNLTTGVISGTIDNSASQSSTQGNPPGTYTVVVTANDGNGGTVTQTFTWTVTNPAPEATNDTNSTDEDTLLNVGAASGVLGNDSDPDGDDLTVSQVNGQSANVGMAVTGSNGGSFTLNPDGSYTFNPGSDFQNLAVGESATTSIEYTVSDGEGGTATATLTVTVNGVNDAPVREGILDPQASLDADTDISVDVTGAFSDPDSTDVLTYTATGLPQGLTLNPNTGVISGTVDNSASQSSTQGNPPGTYTVVVTANDGNGGTVTQTFTWTVTNPAPTAVDDTNSTDEDTALTVTAANGVIQGAGTDTDPDGDDLTVGQVNGQSANVGAAVTGSNGGSFTLNADGSYTFNPGSDFQNLAVGESATTSIEYTVSDGEGGTATATLTITVNGINDAPLQEGTLSPQANEDADDSISVDVTGAFSDPDSTDVLTYTATGLPQGLTLNPNTGLITGTIDNSASQSSTQGNPAGTYTVVVTADDGNGGTVTQTFTWTVTNPAPTAVDDTNSTDEDTALTVTAANGVIQGAGTDTDPDGDELTVSEVNDQAANVGAAVTGSNGGSFTLDADGSYTFNPGSDFQHLPVGESTTTSIEYTVSDGEGGTSKATLTITINGVNDTPVAEGALDPQNNEDADDNISVDVTGGFSDVDDGEVLTYTATGLPQGLTLDPNTGLITGIIDNSASQSSTAGNPAGTYSVVITATDSHGATVTQTFTWTVTNPAPTAVDDTNSTDEDTALTVTAANGVIQGPGTDTDPDGDELTVSEVNDQAANVGAAVTGSNGGSFTLNADGSYTFNPGTDFQHLPVGESTTTSIEYTVSDGEGGTSKATLTITVNGVNDAPVAEGALTPQTNEDADSGISVDVSGGFSDVDDGEVLTYSATGLPEGLDIDENSGLITGVIDNSASQGGTGGVYTVVVTATDSHGAQVTQTFTWTVTNPAPTAVDDTNSTDEDTALTVTAANGVIQGPGTDTDPDSDDLTVSEVNDQAANVGAAVTGSNGGSFTLNADGSYTFNPGNDFQHLPIGESTTTSIEYTVSDGEGGTSKATLTITVNGVNDAPVAEGTLGPQTNEDFDDIISVDVTGAFSDIDGDTLTYTATGLPQGLSLDPNTGIISGIIDNSASQSNTAGNLPGTYTVVVTANDGHSGTVTQTFTWTVTNPAPTAVDDTNSTDEDTALTVTAANGVIQGAGTDTDPDGDDLTVSEVNDQSANVGAAVTGSNGGSFTLNANGSYTFNPGTDFQHLPVGQSTTTSIEYTVSDGEGGTSKATLTITVNGVNDAPVAQGTLGPQTNEDLDSGISVDVTGGFSDADDGEVLTYSTTGLPEGLDVDENTGLITGVIDNSASQSNTAGNPPGTYTVVVTATDSHGAQVTQTFTWTVTNPAPTAVDDTNSTDEDTPLTVTAANGVIKGPGTDTDPDGDDLTVSEVNDQAANVGLAVTGNNGGSFTLNANGSYTFNPDTDFQGLQAGESTTTSIQYTVSDGEGGTSKATLTITVNGVNDAPVQEGTLPSQTNEDFDDVISVDVKGGFSDVDGDTLTYTATGLPQGLSLDPDTGIISGTIDNSASQGGTGGVYTVVVTANDGHSGTVTQTFTWTVTNPAPTAVDDTNSTTEDQVLTVTAANGVIQGTGADTDPDGDALTVSEVNDQAANVGMAVTGSSGGSFTLNANGSYTFNPGTDFQHLPFGQSTTTSIEYTVSDGEGGIDKATLTITVNGVNDAPVAEGTLPPQTNEDADSGISVDVTGAFSDVDDNDTLTYSATGLPQGLSIDENTGLITGIIDNSASQGGVGGVHTVVVTATDSQGAQVTQTFTWTVTNPAPTAVDDTNSTDEDTPLTVTAANGVIQGTGTDTDPDGDTLSVSQVNGQSGNVGAAVTGSNGGSFTLNANGSYTFNPGADFHHLPVGQTATTSVTYTVSDGEGGTDTATLTITVNGVNDAPTQVGSLPPQASEDADSIISVNVKGGFTDVDQGDVLTYTATGLPQGLTLDLNTGIISGVIDNSASQTGTSGNPAGTYTVVVTAKDTHNATVTQTFTWTVTNPVPEARPDHGSITEDGANLVVTAANGVIQSGSALGARDTDPDGDSLAVSHIVAGTAAGLGGFPSGANAGTEVTGAYGKLTLNGDGSYTYVLDNNNPAVNGLNASSPPLSDVFSYAISDGEGGRTFTTLTITINGNTDGAPSITAVDGNGGATGQLTVYESGLTNNGPGGQSATATGTITVAAADGVASVTVGGVLVTLAQLQALSSGSPVDIYTPHGKLSLTGYASSGDVGGVSTGGTLSYTYTLTSTVTNPTAGSTASSEPISLVVRDAAGVTSNGTLTVNIVDDAPSIGTPTTATVYEANLVGGTNTDTAALTQTGSLNIRTGADNGTFNTVFNGSQAALDALNLTSHGVALVYTVSPDGHTLTAKAGASGPTVFTVTLTNPGSATAGYSFQLQGVLDNTAGAPKNLPFGFTVTDADGDTASSTIQVSVHDDAPQAVSQTAISLAEGGVTVGSASGGVNLLGNDRAGADGSMKVTSITYTNEAGNSATAAVPVGGVTVDTRYGSLTVQQDGTWSYTSDATENNPSGVSDNFTYTITDYDGSTSTATQPITVTDTNPVAGPVSLSLDEDDIPVIGSDGTQSNAVTQNLAITKGADNISDVVFNNATITGLQGQNLTSGGTALYYTVTNGGHTLTATAGNGGATVFTLVLNNPTNASGTTQSVTMTLSGPLDHASANGQNTLGINVGYTVSDTDSNVTGSLSITVTDDVPTSVADNTPVTVVEGGNTISGADLMANDLRGADGAHVNQIQYTNEANQLVTVSVPAGSSGITVDTIHGSLTVHQDGTWSYSSDAVVTSGTSVDHSANGGSVNDIFSYNLIDRDGDVSGWTSQIVTVTDTAPTIGTPETDTVNEASLPGGTSPNGSALTQTGSLAVTKAADGIDVTFASTQTVLNALNYTSGGVALVYTVTNGGHTLTATAGSGGATVFTVNITNPTSSSAGYSFTLSKPLDHGVANTLNLPIAYGVVDGDGDSASSTFIIGVVDDTPATNPASASVTEANLPLGTSPNAGALTKTGTLGLTGADNSPIGTVFTAGQVAPVGLTSHGVQVVYTISPDGHTLTATAGSGGPAVFTVTLTNPGSPTAGYSFQLQGVVDNVAGAARNLSFGFTVTDSDGDTASNNIQVSVVDDAPVAVSQTSISLAEGSVTVGSASGGSNLLGNDQNGADGSIKVTSITYTNEAGNSTTAAVPVGGVTVDTRYGSLTVEQDGTWSYTSDPTENNASGVSDNFTYTITDYDGSTSTATQPLTVTDTNPVAGAVSLGIDEDDIPVTGSDGTQSNAVTQNLAITKGPDDISNVVFNAATVTGLQGQSLTSGGVALVYTVTNGGHTLTATAGVSGPTVFTLVMNNPTDATGTTQSVTMTLSGPLDHASANGQNTLGINVGYTVSDTDSSVTGSLSVTVTDDVPTAVVDTTPVSVVEGNNTVGTATGAHNLLANDIQGADGALVNQIRYTDESGNLQTALVGTGGVTVDTIHGSLTVQQSGAWSYTSDPVVTSGTSVNHPKATNDTSIDDVFSYNIIDRDGDVSGWVNQTVTVTDTVPTIGTPDTDTVNEAALPGGTSPSNPSLTQTGTLAVTKGADSIDVTFAGTQTALEGMNLTSGGVALVYAVSNGGHTLTATAGGVTVFTATITNPTAANAGYSFTLAKPLDHGVPNTINLPIAYGVTDGDGDTATSSFTIGVVDDTPATNPASASLTEANLPGGTSPNGPALIKTGTLGLSGADNSTIGTVFDASQTAPVGLTSQGVQLVYVVSNGGHTLTATAGPSGAAVFTVTLTNPGQPNAGYSFQLQGVLDHTGGVAKNLAFGFTVTDADGDTASNNIQVSVADDAPQAVNQSAISLAEGGVTVSSSSGGTNLLGNDKPGADGSKVTSITYTNEAGSSTVAAVPVGGVTVDTRYGSLTVQQDGTWSYTSDPTENNASGVADNFSYTITDYDGSTATASQPLTVNDTHPVVGAVSLGIDEDDIPTIGSGGASTPNVVEQNLAITKGPDNITDVVFNAATITGLQGQNLTSGGTALHYTITNSGHTLTATAGNGGATVFTLQLNNPTNASGTTQSVTMTVSGPLDHANANGENTLAINVGYRVTDIDSGVDGSLSITVTDDIPTAVIDTTPVSVVEGNNTVGTGTGAANLLTNDVQGADGARVYQIQYTNEAGQLTTALVGTGGVTVDTIHGSLTVQQNGTWSYTSDPVVTSGTSVNHPKATNDTSIDDVFTYNIIDRDGDVSGWVNQTVTVTDTVPTIGTPDTDTVYEANLPGGTSPNGTPLTQTGSLAVTKGADSINVTFAGTQTALEALNLKSGGVALVYVVTNGGHTLTATAGGATVFTATITSPTSNGAGYSFTLAKPLDHGAATPINLPIAYGVTDGDGDTATNSFTIAVVDDTPASTQSFTLDEDSTTGVTFNTSADATSTNVVVSNPPNGTATVNANGTVTYVPDPNFSGTDTFTYTTTADDGAAQVTTVTVTVNPISDAPTITVDAASIITNEDVPVALGLNAPVVTDATDQNGGAAGDNPELLGVISLSGLPAGAKLLDAGGTVLFTSTGAAITIQLSDGSHLSGLSPNLTMTKAQYEALQVLPAAETHGNFTVTVGVTSYEVQNDGTQIPGVPGAPSSNTVRVNVQAVTDPVDLSLVDGGDADSSATEHTIAEDASFDLKDLLSVAFPNTDNNTTADIDGTETRWFEISGLPIGTTVNGVTVTAQNPVITVAAPGLSTSATGLPAMVIDAPANYSGDVSITVTLKAQDNDADGIGSGATQGVIVQDAVTLTLHIVPVAGDVAAGDVETTEDTPVAFLADVRVTDTGTTNGSEVITKVEFEVPTGWTVNPPTAGAGYTAGLSGTTYTISFDNTLSEAQRESVLDSFTITPPGHSSADKTITVKVTSADTVDIGGSPVTSTSTVDLDVKVTVTPVAEGVGGDSDGDNVDDVTMTPGHAYDTPGYEDTWFNLGTEATFKLGDGWTNQDSDEETYARLTPELVLGDGANVNAAGSQFRYSTNGDTTEGGGAWVTVTFSGTPVDIPIAYLNTLQFKAAENFSGSFNIEVKAYTVDTDPDTLAEVENVSGSAMLTNLVIEPVADDVTVALNARAPGLEDTLIPLNVRPTSSDPSETFDVTISGIPAGAQLYYDGVAQTAIGGVVTIVNFKAALGLSIQPPLNSNNNFTLGVSAVSVDGSDISDAQTLSVNVTVKGVADVATVTPVNVTYVEADLDSGSDQVLLKEMMTSSKFDNDGSEVLTLRVTGLPQGFSLSQGTVLVSGTGAERVWVLTEAQFQTVFVRTPANFSGTQTFTVTPVTTENDGDSRTGTPSTLSINVTPSTEAVTTTSKSIAEDTLTNIGLGIVHNNGDTDETLTRVWVEVADANSPNFTLYLGTVQLSAAGLAVETIGGVDYYVMTGAQAATLAAKGAANLDGPLGSFDFKYEIRDANFGSQPSGTATLTVHDGSFQLTATPVTDVVDIKITSISGGAGTTASDSDAGDANTHDTAVLNAQDQVTVTLNITKPVDPGSAGGTADLDASEQVTRVVIEGVPDGVSVQGAEYIGGGTWLLIYTGGDLIPITGASGISLPIVFDVSQLAGSIEDAPIKIEVQTQDRGSAGIQLDTVTWHLTTTFADGDGAEPAAINEWVYNASHVSEDVQFTLADVIDANIVVLSPDAPNTFTVTLTDVPEGTVIDGMVLTLVDGQETWTASITTEPGDDTAAANAKLEALLQGITITAPPNSNENNAEDDFHMNATLATSVPGGDTETNTIEDMTVPVDPVTDPTVITIVAGTIDEGTADIPVTITLSNAADQAYGEIIDGKLYVRVDPANSTNGLDAGTLTYNGDPIDTEVVGGDTYYVIENVTVGTPINLVYTPTNSTAGQVAFVAQLQSQEQNSTLVVTSTGTGISPVNIINNGATITTALSVGDESTKIVIKDLGAVTPIDNLAVTLNDNDGSETVRTVLLSDVPNGFLVYIGTSEATAALASNAGGDGTLNTWVISNANGSLPAYIAIEPPLNWSGTLADLKIKVESGETVFSDGLMQTFELADVKVNPLADGLTMAATKTFGPENLVIPLNLNAAMADPKSASVPGAPDAHQETTTLKLTGLGAYASFYVGETQHTDGVTYDAGTGTYTLTGLSQKDLDGLGFLQAKIALIDQDAGAAGVQIKVEAFTIDGSDISPSAHASLTVSALQQIPSSGDDHLLWTGNMLNGGAGTDTVQLRYQEDLSGSMLDSKLDNIEKLALHDNHVTSLSAADVLGMTGTGGSTLTINGSAADHLTLTSGEWTSAGAPVDIGGIQYAIYTATAGATPLELRVQTGIHVD